MRWTVASMTAPTSRSAIGTHLRDEPTREGHYGTGSSLRQYLCAEGQRARARMAAKPEGPQVSKRGACPPARLKHQPSCIRPRVAIDWSPPRAPVDPTCG